MPQVLVGYGFRYGWQSSYGYRYRFRSLGVASYDNVQIKQIEAQLPSVEELKKRIRLLEEELAAKKR